MSRPVKEFDHVRIKAFGIEGYVVDVSNACPLATPSQKKRKQKRTS